MDTISALTDFALLDWIHSQRNSFLDLFFRTVTWAGSLYFLVPATGLLLLLLYRFDKPREIKLLAFSLFCTVLITHGAKALFQRPRPEIHPAIVPQPVDWSFPSAHTAQITTICLCLGLLAFRYLSIPAACFFAAILLLLTLAVGFSRIYLQVHYPTDVLAGLVLGIVVVTATDLLLAA